MLYIYVSSIESNQMTSLVPLESSFSSIINRETSAQILDCCARTEQRKTSILGWKYFFYQSLEI